MLDNHTPSARVAAFADDPVTFPTAPPAAWFHDLPDWLDTTWEAGLVQINPQGRVAALVAPYGECILDGGSNCWMPPTSPTGYEYAHVGTVISAEGEPVRVANIGGGVSHYDLRDPYAMSPAVKHYSNTATRVMVGRYHDRPDAGGIVFLGSMWPTASELDVVEARASALSGDWRWVESLGGHDMAGAQLVNNPGFRPNRQRRNAMLSLGVMNFAVAASLAAPGGMENVALRGTWTPQPGSTYAVLDRLAEIEAVLAHLLNAAVVDDEPVTDDDIADAETVAGLTDDAGYPVAVVAGGRHSRRPNPLSSPKEIAGRHGHKPHGPSIRWPALYEHLKAKGYSKQKAAMISNGQWRKRHGLPPKSAPGSKGKVRVASVGTPVDLSGAVINGEPVTGANIVLVPDDPAALAVPGGDPEDILHVTVKYLNQAESWTDTDREQVNAMVGDWARRHGPFTATVGGVGTLGDNGAVVYHLDVPGLTDARGELSDRIDSETVHDTSDTYDGYTPHLTAGYNLDPMPDRPTDPVTFSRARVQWADQGVEFPLGEPQAYTAAGRKHVRDADKDGKIFDGTPKEQPYIPLPDEALSVVKETFGGSDKDVAESWQKAQAKVDAAKPDEMLKGGTPNAPGVHPTAAAAQQRGKVHAKVTNPGRMKKFAEGDTVEVAYRDAEFGTVWTTDKNGKNRKYLIRWDKLGEPDLDAKTTEGYEFATSDQVKAAAASQGKVGVRVGDGRLWRAGIGRGDHVDATFVDDQFARVTAPNGKDYLVRWERFDAVGTPGGYKQAAEAPGFKVPDVPAVEADVPEPPAPGSLAETLAVIKETYPEVKLDVVEDVPRWEKPDGMSDERWAQIEPMLSKLADEYPEVGFKGVKWIDPEASSALATKDKDTILLNPDLWKSWTDEDWDQRAEEFGKAHALVDPSPAGVIAHEFGHILDGWILEQLADDPDARARYDAFHDRAKESVNAPSTYAMDNGYEFAAETFAALVNGNHALGEDHPWDESIQQSMADLQSLIDEARGKANGVEADAPDVTPEVPDDTGTLTPMQQLGVPYPQQDLPNPKGKGEKGWTKTGAQGGSNPGGLFEDPNGTSWYVKDTKSEDHAKVEVAANLLYELAGIDVPEVVQGTQGDRVASKIVEGDKIESLSQAIKNDPEAMAKIREGLVVDAWLANWDVAGLGLDNIIVADGEPKRIDSGGALTYRAMGSPKGAAFGDKVTEIDTLRDPSKNAAAAKVFGPTTEEELRAGAEKVAAVTPEQIQKVVDDMGLEQSIADKLIARRQDIIDRLLPADMTPEPAAPEVAPGTAPTTDVAALTAEVADLGQQWNDAFDAEDWATAMDLGGQIAAKQQQIADASPDGSPEQKLALSSKKTIEQAAPYVQMKLDGAAGPSVEDAAKAKAVDDLKAQLYALPNYNDAVDAGDISAQHDIAQQKVDLFAQLAQAHSDAGDFGVADVAEAASDSWADMVAELESQMDAGTPGGATTDVPGVGGTVGDDMFNAALAAGNAWNDAYDAKDLNGQLTAAKKSQMLYQGAAEQYAAADDTGKAQKAQAAADAWQETIDEHIAEGAVQTFDMPVEFAVKGQVVHKSDGSTATIQAVTKNPDVVWLDYTDGTAGQFKVGEKLKVSNAPEVPADAPEASVGSEKPVKDLQPGDVVTFDGDEITVNGVTPYGNNGYEVQGTNVATGKPEVMSWTTPDAKVKLAEDAPGPAAGDTPTTKAASDLIAGDTIKIPGGTDDDFNVIAVTLLDTGPNQGKVLVQGEYDGGGSGSFIAPPGEQITLGLDQPPNGAHVPAKTIEVGDTIHHPGLGDLTVTEASTTPSGKVWIKTGNGGFGQLWDSFPPDLDFAVTKGDNVTALDGGAPSITKTTAELQPGDQFDHPQWGQVTVTEVAKSKFSNNGQTMVYYQTGSGATMSQTYADDVPWDVTQDSGSATAASKVSAEDLKVGDKFKNLAGNTLTVTGEPFPEETADGDPYLSIPVKDQYGIKFEHSVDSPLDEVELIGGDTAPAGPTMGKVSDLAKGDVVKTTVGNKTVAQVQAPAKPGLSWKILYTDGTDSIKEGKSEVEITSKGPGEPVTPTQKLGHDLKVGDTAPSGPATKIAEALVPGDTIIHPDTKQPAVVKYVQPVKGGVDVGFAGPHDNAILLSNYDVQMAADAPAAPTQKLGHDLEVGDIVVDGGSYYEVTYAETGGAGYTTVKTKNLATGKVDTQPSYKPGSTETVMVLPPGSKPDLGVPTQTSNAPQIDTTPPVERVEHPPVAPPDPTDKWGDPPSGGSTTTAATFTPASSEELFAAAEAAGDEGIQVRVGDNRLSKRGVKKGDVVTVTAVQGSKAPAVQIKAEGDRPGFRASPDRFNAIQTDTGGSVDNDDLGFVTAMTAVSSNPHEGSAFAFDSDLIEDTNVRVRAVTYRDGDTDRPVHAFQFKVTEAHTAGMEAALADAQRSHGTSVPNEVNGVVMPGTGQTFAGSTWSKDVTLPDGRTAKVRWLRSDSKSEGEPWALNNMVQVHVFDDGQPVTQDDVAAIMGQLGVGANYPSTEDQQALFGNVLDSVFHKPGSGLSGREAAAKIGITSADVSLRRVGNSVTPVLTPEATEKVLQHGQMKGGGFHHKFWKDGNPTNPDPDIAFSMITGEGLMSTTTRWSEGVGNSGMSSPTDIKTGGADYVFTRQSSTMKGSDTGVMINADRALQRLDWFAYSYDNYGKQWDSHKASRNNILNLRDKSGSRETMFKRSVPVEDWNHITMASSDRVKLIAKLKERGVVSINGVPVDEFVRDANGPIPVTDGSGVVYAADAPAAPVAPVV